MVLREAGRPEKALEHLMEYESLMHDKLVVREIKGTCSGDFVCRHTCRCNKADLYVHIVQCRYL